MQDDSDNIDIAIQVGESTRNDVDSCENEEMLNVDLERVNDEEGVSNISVKDKSICGHVNEKVTNRNKKQFHCRQFSEDDKEHLLEEFQKADSFSVKKLFFEQVVLKRTKSISPSKCSTTYLIKIPKKNGDKLRVCRKFFMKILKLEEKLFQQLVGCAKKRDKKKKYKKSRLETDIKNNNYEPICQKKNAAPVKINSSTDDLRWEFNDDDDEEVQTSSIICSHPGLVKKSERTYMCGQFSEEDRNQLIKIYSELKLPEEKKKFVCGLVKCQKFCRRKKGGVEQDSEIKYQDIYLTKLNGEKIRVCRRFFLNTLNLKLDTFQEWIKPKQSKDSVASSRKRDNANNNKAQNILKKPREMKGRCSHSKTEERSNRTFLCAQFSELDRKQIFDQFWNLSSWSERRNYVSSTLASVGCTRKRKINKNDAAEPAGKKPEGHYLSLVKSGGVKVRVCRLFFLNTLDLGEETFKRWMIKRRGEVQTPVVISEENLPVPVTQLVESIRKKKQNEARIKVKKWLNLLPKIPKEYHRRSSDNVYVESTFRTVLHMHSIYKEWCVTNKYKTVGKYTFSQILHSENIYIHIPKREQCVQCYSYSSRMTSEANYHLHIQQTAEAQTAKEAAFAKYSSNKLVIAIDLQSIFQCPKLKANSLLYYKQKLQVHNFTVYEVNEREVTVYMWHEANGGISSNEYTSCIIHYLNNVSKNYAEVVLLTDDVVYNSFVLSNALSTYCMETGRVIEHLILEEGHLMTEIDTVNAMLEYYFKPPINSPSDYMIRIQSCSYRPYKINMIDYTFFKNYKDLAFSKITEKQTVINYFSNNIRSLLYLPSGEIQYRIEYNGEWYHMKPVLNSNHVPDLSSLYSGPLPISETKFRHLQDLKTVIRKEHHQFYDNLLINQD